MTVRARSAATSLRSRLAMILALGLIGPIVVAVIALAVLAPRAARSAAQHGAQRTADSVVLALGGRCDTISKAATATAGEVQAYATRDGTLTAVAATTAVQRAVGRLPGTAVAVFDARAQLLAVAGAPAGLGPAAAGGYGASCSADSAGDRPWVAGLSERLPVDTTLAGRVGYVVFWVPLDNEVLRSLREGLGAGGQLGLFAAGSNGSAEDGLLASTGSGVEQATAIRIVGAGRASGAMDGVGYAVRQARPGVPFRVFVALPAGGGELLPIIGLLVLAALLLALLPIRMIAGRLSDPMLRELGSAAGELQLSRAALAGTFERFGDALQNTHNLENLLDTVAAACLYGTGAIAGMALLIENSAEEPDSTAGTLQALGRACAEHPAARQALAELPGFAERYFHGLDGAAPTPLFARLAGAGPAVAVPIRAGAGVIGVLALARGESAAAFDALALPRLRALADHLGTAIHNVRLHDEARRQSVTDALTGVGNVRQLSTTLSREVERATRFERPLTVLMLDLDHFKRVNDTLGHPFGDLVLREFAHRLQACVREVDTVARYGGEEFAVVLPETDVDGGSRVADRILNAVRSEPFRHGELRHAVTVSIGVAAFPRHGRSAAEVLQAADEALYLAKNEGRDRCEIAGISSAPSAVSQAG